MNRTILLALLVSSRVVLAQNVTLPYNPDANQDSVIGTPDLLEFLPYFGGAFIPGEVLIDGENLTDYVAFLEAAAANATSDTITIPMMPGTEPGEMLYWTGEQWFLVPTGESGDALILSGDTPTWKALKLGCTNDGFIEFDPEATIDDGSCEIVAIPGCTVQGSCNFDPDATQNDGSCVAQQEWWIDSDGDGLGDTEGPDVTRFSNYTYQPTVDCEESVTWSTSIPGDSCYDLLALNFDDPANGPCEYPELDCQPVTYHDYTYATVQIGGKCWFAENLRTEEWRDGSSIASVNSVEDWSVDPQDWTVPEGVVTYYGEGDSDCWSQPDLFDYDPCVDELEVVQQFGRLYTLAAAYSDNHGGLCPTGWGIGSGFDWNSMLYAAASQSIDGDTYPIQAGEWLVNSAPLADTLLLDPTGFAALPGGWRDVESGYLSLGYEARWWGGNEGYQAFATDVNASELEEGFFGPPYFEARSVRCVQVTEGCTDNNACNYDFSAVDDDGSCEYLTCGAVGCTVPEACNYNPASVIDDGTCFYPDMGYDCTGNCLPFWLDSLGNCTVETMECIGGMFDDVITTGPLSAMGGVVQYDFEAIGELYSVSLTVNWTSFEDSFPGDLSLLLVSPQGQSLLIAGTDSPFGFSFDHIESLPASWNSMASGEYVFSCSGYGLSGDGTWQLHAGNGWGLNVPFEFTLDLQGLCILPGSASNTCSSIEFDGHTYSVVEIGDQCWFAENLRTTVYGNGDAIPAGLTDSEWGSTASGATAVYGEDDGCENYSPDIDACDEAQSLEEYGRLYNWYAVDDARGLCPNGWHVPTDEEWMVLEMELGMSESEANSTGWRGTDEGTQLMSTYCWYDGGNGTDNFGFSALPGGNRKYNGYFNDAGDRGYWWSSSPSGGYAWYRYLDNPNPGISRSSNFPRFGFSVRCLRDAE